MRMGIRKSTRCNSCSIITEKHDISLGHVDAAGEGGRESGMFSSHLKILEEIANINSRYLHNRTVHQNQTKGNSSTK